MTLKLHNFFRSSTSTRLRAALNLKGLSYDYILYVLSTGENADARVSGEEPARSGPYP